MHQHEAVTFRTNQKTIEIKQGNEWKPFPIKGVNMGSGYPGYFPEDYGIDEDTYYHWFELIAEMNANTIRVYRLESPAFYKALLNYNKEHEKKVYLLQNLDFPDTLMFSLLKRDQHADYLYLIEQTEQVIDALHGNKMIVKDNTAYMYVSDVSDYVLGYMIGIEWDEMFVEYVNKSKTEFANYKGKYLYADKQATPFENILAQWGDYTLSYEEERYHVQKVLSFANWAETDPIKNEIVLQDAAGTNNLEVFVDIDHIKMSDQTKTGIFASYNIYPYYPLFLQEGEYTKFVDEHGKHNPYRYYLTQLVKQHDYPVVISEYGIPSSRSVAYHDRWRKFSHGGLNEKQQSAAVKVLNEDINKAGCAGSMVFSWQDEWFKRAWNEMTLSDPDYRPQWNNVQCAEQNFGILTYELDGKQQFYPDGNFDEWKTIEDVIVTDDIRVKVAQDERYLHLYVDGLDPRKNKSKINIALDITPKSGKSTVLKTALPFDTDFVINIQQNGKSALYVDQYYDVLSYSFLGVYHDSTISGLELLNEMYDGLSTPLKGSKDFSVVARADNRTYSLSGAKPIINEVGFLKHGNANPTSKNFDSNADYYIVGNQMEIRIPWQLLNFYNPSKGSIIDDFNKNNFHIKGYTIDQIQVAAYYDDETKVSNAGEYELKNWKKPKVKERLRSVYYTLQDIYGGNNK